MLIVLIDEEVQNRVEEITISQQQVSISSPEINAIKQALADKDTEIAAISGVARVANEKALELEAIRNDMYNKIVSFGQSLEARHKQLSTPDAVLERYKSWFQIK